MSIRKTRSVLKKPYPKYNDFSSYKGDLLLHPRLHKINNKHKSTSKISLFIERFAEYCCKRNFYKNIKNKAYYWFPRDHKLTKLFGVCQFEFSELREKLTPFIYKRSYYNSFIKPHVEPMSEDSELEEKNEETLNEYTESTNNKSSEIEYRDDTEEEFDSDYDYSKEDSLNKDIEKFYKQK